VAINGNSTRNKTIVIVLVAVIILGAASSLLSGLVSSRSTPAPAVTAPVTETPAASESSIPVDKLPVMGTVVSGPTFLSEADLALATGATAPLVVVSGTYIGLEGYELFDTLTVLRFESGEQAYFVSNGGFFPSSGGIPADQTSRDLTGFGADLAADSAEAIEAGNILRNHRIEIG